MATFSSILAWRIPWTEEPGGLQSMGSQEADTTERLTLSLLSMCIKRLINEQYALFFLFCLSFLEGTLLI